ncbi:MAG: hypothetical protein EOP45_16740 [Sphingobacteriaceae bacterium]|nr:MAG: hypothetical protein EOP45_16740 [Sphingobacteriaceae bacterium]
MTDPLEETLRYIEKIDKQDLCQLIPRSITSTFEQIRENYESIEHVLPKQGHIASFINTAEDGLTYIARMYDKGEAQQRQVVLCVTNSTEGIDASPYLDAPITSY